MGPKFGRWGKLLVGVVVGTVVGKVAATGGGVEAGVTLCTESDPRIVHTRRLDGAGSLRPLRRGGKGA